MVDSPQMPPDGARQGKPGFKKLHKDLKRLDELEQATRESGRGLARYGAALVFLAAAVAVSALFGSGGERYLFVIAAGLLGGYMAMNIGANDVANNIGPAVGAKAITMVGALAIAAVFEAAGALLAGGDVVKTISKGIISPDMMADANTFIMAMMAALLAAALWVNLATMVGAPVSTTHAVVGGVMGGGIAATGFGSVHWDTMGMIAASWVISPVVGGLVAALFLAFIKFAIVFKDDKVNAAKRWVPVLVALMAAAFSVYLMMKGLKRIWKPEPWMLVVAGAAVFALTHTLVRPVVARKAEGMENRRKAVSSLFTLPLVFSAALLSFAHGANDVANAVGPLAAIVTAAQSGTIAAEVKVPLWVLATGAVGISLGLMLFGPKLVRTVGEKITKLDRIRAFCVALSAAITVIIASALGLPISSTHTAVGAVFGVGFFREFLTESRRRRARVAAHAAAVREAEASGQAIDPVKLQQMQERSARRRLVRRSHFMTIVAAWVITVPLAALLSATLFFVLNGFFGD